MGTTNFASASVLTRLRDALLKLHCRVLWKVRHPEHNLPDHIRAVTWVPQNDVLGHPNVRAFLTHGGWSAQLHTALIVVQDTTASWRRHTTVRELA